MTEPQSDKRGCPNAERAPFKGGLPSCVDQSTCDWRLSCEAEASRSSSGEPPLNMSLESRLKDAEDDVLRLHKEKMKFFERTIDLERELAEAKNDIRNGLEDRDNEQRRADRSEAALAARPSQRQTILLKTVPNNHGGYDYATITPMDLEATLRGALKEQAESCAVAEVATTHCPCCDGKCDAPSGPEQSK